MNQDARSTPRSLADRLSAEADKWSGTACRSEEQFDLKELLREAAQALSEKVLIPEFSASGDHPLKLFVGRPREWITVQTDPTVPEGTVEVRDSVTGRVMGRIINVGR
jgi:hypothetical protein